MMLWNNNNNGIVRFGVDILFFFGKKYCTMLCSWQIIKIDARTYFCQLTLIINFNDGKARYSTQLYEAVIDPDDTSQLSCSFIILKNICILNGIKSVSIKFSKITS